MRVAGTATLLVTEPLLVQRMGVEGAALSVVLSNTIAMVLGFWLLVTRRAPAHLDWGDLRLDLPMMRHILRIALPAMLQRGTPNLAMAIFMRLVAGYGAPTLAAWVVVRRIADFSLTPSMALSRAQSAMVGQNLGARKPERADGSLRIVVRLVMLMEGITFGLLALAAPWVVGLFIPDSETISIGVHVIRVLAMGYLAYAVSLVLESTQSGAGDTVSPMVINLFALWAIQVPLAVLFSQALGLGADGVWFAIVAGWILQAFLMGLRVRQGRWKLRRV